METKFTKGKWKLAENEYGYYTSVRNLDDSRKVCVSRVNNQIESNANLLLISKAPEMLEMLKELIHAFEGENLHGFQEERLSEAKQLIKEATEL
jgi:hypothetical protein